jgi:hypothetical protein
VAGQSRNSLSQEKRNMIATKTFFVALAGALLCLNLCSVTDLWAEEPQTKPATDTAAAPEGGKLVGILTHFEYNWTKVNSPKPDMRLSLKAEGETDSVDYLLALPNEAVDPKLETALRKVFPSNTVSMQWEMRNDKRLVTKVSVLTPTGGQGTIVGTVMARDKGSLDLKGADRRAVTTRYVAAWDPATKGPNPAVMGALQGLGVGDKVKISWSANPERLWLNHVQLVSRSPANRSAGGSQSEPSKGAAPKP